MAHAVGAGFRSQPGQLSWGGTAATFLSGRVLCPAGPMLTGYISDMGGFDGVFIMLYTAATVAGLLLIRLCAKEVRPDGLPYIPPHLQVACLTRPGSGT